MTIRTLSKPWAERIVVFFIALIVSLGSIGTICSRYNSLGFDSQNVMTWDYEALTHLQPYKDVGYYYGLLPYFRNNNVIAFLVYALIAPLLLTFFFVVFRRIFQKRFFAYIAVTALLVFVMTYIGMDNFSRYGIGVCFALLTAMKLYEKKKLDRFAFHAGIAAMVIFSLVTDQGVFMVSIFFGMILIQAFLSQETRGRRVHELIQQSLQFAIGSLIGIVPFVLYLLGTRSFESFLGFMHQLSLTTNFAKAPFLPFAAYPSNLFTFSALFIALLLLSYRLFFDKKSLTTLAGYIEIALVLSIIVIEQKSFVRSIDSTITFVSFLLWLAMMSEILPYLRRSFEELALLLVILCLGLPVGFRLPMLSSLSTTQMFDRFTQSITMIVNPKAMQRCRVDSLKPDHLPLPPAYAKVLTFFNQPEQTGRTVFSFPGDPIFYVLLNQQPPKYFTTYESSPDSAQQEQIAYIEKMQVEYVIYNTQNTEMDGVPQVVRGETLARYIINNFAPYKRIDQFIIFKRSINPSFFSIRLSEIKDVQTQLLNINLENIPRAEGKKSIIRGTMWQEGSIEQINAYLTTIKPSSDNLFVLITTESAEPYTTLSFTTETGITTQVMFRACNKTQKCIVHLSNLPLFYRSQTVVGMGVINDTTAKIQLLSLPDHAAFW